MNLEKVYFFKVIFSENFAGWFFKNKSFYRANMMEWVMGISNGLIPQFQKAIHRL